jgi:hypothetical protein
MYRLLRTRLIARSSYALAYFARIDFVRRRGAGVRLFEFGAGIVDEEFLRRTVVAERAVGANPCVGDAGIGIAFGNAGLMLKPMCITIPENTELVFLAR